MNYPRYAATKYRRDECIIPATTDSASDCFHGHDNTLFRAIGILTWCIECKQSKQCSAPKHHFDDCVERVQQQESEGEAKEDCVEECTLSDAIRFATQTCHIPT